MKRIIFLLQNKYILSTTAFFIWMLCFDRNTFYQHYEYWDQLNTLKKEKQYIEQEIIKTETELEELNSNNDKLEKFAREKYLMKKDNEEIFIIVNETTK